MAAFLLIPHHNHHIITYELPRSASKKPTFSFCPHQTHRPFHPPSPFIRSRLAPSTAYLSSATTPLFCSPPSSFFRFYHSLTLPKKQSSHHSLPAPRPPAFTLTPSRQPPGSSTIPSKSPLFSLSLTSSPRYRPTFDRVWGFSPALLRRSFPPTPSAPQHQHLTQLTLAINTQPPPPLFLHPSPPLPTP
jgi:hypothetical protein